ncbi:DUF3772 domain-containing protein [Actibacterium sp. D379-3]
MVRLLALLLCLSGGAALLSPLAASAQTAQAQTVVPDPATQIDYAAWEATAARAEAAIEAGRASNLALEQVRAELVEWRAKFLTGQGANQTRIQTLREQIAALGPVPETGVTEPAELAERRAALSEQLARAQAPGVAAEEAYRRADGLIREIDTIIRDRQADELLQLGPSPLNPAHWRVGAAAAAGTLRALAQETGQAWQNPIHRTGLRQALPAVLFYLAVAAVLLLRGRRWIDKLSQRLVRKQSIGGGAVYAALLSLGQIALPLAGVMALLQAGYATGLIGLRGSRVADLIPPLAMTLFVALWLGGRVFPKASARAPLFNLTPDRAAEGRWIATGLGVVLVLGRLLSKVAEFDNYPPEASVTLGFPVLVAGGLLIYRMARLLMIHVRSVSGDDGGDDHPYRNSIVLLVARVAMALAVVGPALAAVGYGKAASYFTYPVIATLGVLALLMVMQRFIVDLYALVTRDPEGAGDALIPVLLGFGLSGLAMPVLALIWGARVSDLTELWTRFSEGFQVGGTRISPADFLTFAVVFAVGYMATRLLQGGLRASVLPKTKIDTGGQNAIVSGIGYLGIFLAGLIAITAAGIDLSSLAIVAGALSVGIGFGLQNIVSNFVSGIILLIERPVSEGDWIEVGGMMGTVRAISVRSTRIETFDRTDVIVPNSDLISGVVTNWTRSNLNGRITLKVGVAYGSDTRKAQSILEEIAQAHPIVIINPPPLVTFMGFGADSLDFEVRAVLSDVNFGLSVRSELNHEIARRFAEEGIEIPFAQRDIWLRNPEALRGPFAPAAVPASAAPAATEPVAPSETPPAMRTDPMLDPDTD